MKEALVDVPVQINIWVREECQRKQFEIIKEARPSIIILQSDGGRNDEEWQSIYHNRQLFETGIDWECEIHRLYENVNNGMYAMIKKTWNYVFSRFDRCIFLEDDIVPSLSFFSFCAELLEKYKNDTRIHYITGLNYHGIYEDPSHDYFFSGEGCIWGFATWRRTFLEQNREYRTDKYALKCIKAKAKKTKRGYEKRIQGYADNDTFMGHIAGPEFYKNLLRFSQNQICIVPKKNMISCIGIGEGSTHSSDSLKKLPKAIQKHFFMKTYEIEFPINHPQYVVCDLNYDKYVCKELAWNHPFVQLHRKISRFVRCAIYGDIKKLRQGLKAQFITHKEQ